MESCNLDIHKSSYLQAKVHDINTLLNRSWTSKEIQEKLDRQNKYRPLFKAPVRQVVGPETLERDEALQRLNMESRRRNEEQVRNALLRDRRNRMRRAAQRRKDEEARKKAEAEGTLVEVKEEKKPEPISL